ncbi:MAG: ankyrin repeat domain-containing protein [Planctomycetes bacterium]|nr:ankyrin repeat domain-containing protein [Planctomycetota bacterium]
MSRACVLAVLVGLLLGGAPAELLADPGHIHAAAQAGDLTRVRTLLADAPELVDSPDSLGRTPLHAAALARDARVLALLLERGAKPNAKDAAGETALFIAARAGRVELVQRLLTSGAGANLKNLRGASPLHVIATDGQRTPPAQAARKAIAGLLLAAGADVDAADGEGMTALHVGLARQRDELVAALIEGGADVHLRDANGRTPLYYAALSNNSKAIALLVEKKADVDLADKAGNTALHAAALRCRCKAIELLLKSGANVAAPNQNGETALHVLAAQQFRAKEAEQLQVAIAELLIAHGADVNQRASDGTTPLGRASDKGRAELVRLLREKGGVH